MAFLTQGGSQIGSANIVDGSILNADINANAAIAQTKIAGSANGNTDLISVEATAAATHSLTTVANQRVVVIAKGTTQHNAGANPATTNLKYNGVVKDSVTSGVATTDNAAENPFCLVYTEVPGAATQNITVDTNGGSVTSVSITVLKIKG